MSPTPAGSSDRATDLSAEDALIVREAMREFAEMEAAPPFPEALQRRIDAEMGAAGQPGAPGDGREAAPPGRR